MLNATKSMVLDGLRMSFHVDVSLADSLRIVCGKLKSGRVVNYGRLLKKFDVLSHKPYQIE